jgi:hypothetical protein
VRRITLVESLTRNFRLVRNNERLVLLLLLVWALECASHRLRVNDMDIVMIDVVDYFRTLQLFHLIEIV